MPLSDQHEHKYIFIKFAWRTKDTGGRSTGPVETEDYSLWICECGAAKEVIHSKIERIE